jgi:hypothetical protein
MVIWLPGSVTASATITMCARSTRPGGLVELRLHLAVHAERPLGRGEDGLLQRLHQHLAVDVLVLRDLVEDQAEARTFTHDALL